MKNNALEFDQTHWTHHKGLNTILLRQRLKCILVSQTDFIDFSQKKELFIIIKIIWINSVSQTVPSPPPGLESNWAAYRRMLVVE